MRRRTTTLIALGTILTIAAAVGLFAIHSDPKLTADTLSKAELRQRTGQIISSFENSSTDIPYGSVETLDDGRGITAGRAGFTSGTGDLLQVLERYDQLKPGNSLSKYIPAVKADNNSDSTTGLDGFAEAWKRAASDSQLQAAQDDIYDLLYFSPALEAAEALEITSAAGKLIILDTLVQHGDGDDADGLPAIVGQTNRLYGSLEDENDEKAWLEAFLGFRRQHLQNAADPSTRQAWSESVDRVDALSSILEKEPSLSGTLRWSVYGDNFSLPALD